MQEDKIKEVNDYYRDIVKLMFEENTSRIKITIDCHKSDGTVAPAELAVILLSVDGVETGEASNLGVE